MKNLKCYSQREKRLFLKMIYFDLFLAAAIAAYDIQSI
jgi:hypothetical protein